MNIASNLADLLNRSRGGGNTSLIVASATPETVVVCLSHREVDAVRKMLAGAGRSAEVVNINGQNASVRGPILVDNHVLLELCREAKAAEVRADALQQALATERERANGLEAEKDNLSARISCLRAETSELEERIAELEAQLEPRPDTTTETP